jgi:hypothetical protein
MLPDLPALQLPLLSATALTNCSHQLQAQIGELLSTLDTVWQSLAGAEAQRDSALQQIRLQAGKATQLEQQQAQLQALQEQLAQQVQQALVQQAQAASAAAAQGSGRQQVLASFPLSAPRAPPRAQATFPSAASQGQPHWQGNDSDNPSGGGYAGHGLTMAHRSISLPVGPSSGLAGQTRSQLLAGVARNSSSRTLQLAPGGAATAGMTPQASSTLGKSDSARSQAAAQNLQQARPDSAAPGPRSPNQTPLTHQLHSVSSNLGGSRVQELEQEVAALHAVVAAKTYEAYMLRNQLHTLQLLRDSEELQHALRSVGKQQGGSSSNGMESTALENVRAVLSSGIYGEKLGSGAAGAAAERAERRESSLATLEESGEGEESEEEETECSEEEDLLQRAAQQIQALAEELKQQVQQQHTLGVSFAGCQ